MALRTDLRTDPEDVRRAAVDEFPEHEGLTVAFEHGQWWVLCSPCGAAWSVHEAEPGPLAFEVVAEGDDSCRGEGGP